ncbi:MAG: hypothetical protein EGQ81_09085 [Akkermansia sp.]|nr:hypothetical protein [Akkermansia sp.]
MGAPPVLDDVGSRRGPAQQVTPVIEHVVDAISRIAGTGAFQQEEDGKDRRYEKAATRRNSVFSCWIWIFLRSVQGASYAREEENGRSGPEENDDAILQDGRKEEYGAHFASTRS